MSLFFESRKNYNNKVKITQDEIDNLSFMKKKVLCRYYSKNTSKHLKNNTNSTLIYFGKKNKNKKGMFYLV